MVLLTAILLFVFVLCTNGYVFIGTGRGVVRVEQRHSQDQIMSMYEEVDTAYYNDDDAVLWTLETDARFPNGVFIRSKIYPDLVWDISGRRYVSGNRIILYAKQNTLEDTKNQRWQISGNRIRSINDQNWVATADGYLAWYSSASQSQDLYILEQYSEVPVAIRVQSETLVFTVTSRVGTHSYTIPPGGTFNASLFPTSSFSFSDAYGVRLSSFATPSQSIYTFPQTQTYYSWLSFTRGSCCCTVGYTNTITSAFSFAANGVFSGHGIDCRGAFSVMDGTYTNTGLVVFKKLYDTGDKVECSARYTGSGGSAMLEGKCGIRGNQHWGTFSLSFI